ncbi:hypothetical protein GQ607_013061 [Colletotrichum asianum]|uniref:Uncharacterized protein n=1 Tax=Colletotrichum asianum TaxID=702518 RepID=A0A8H3VZW2_9PEZI|nr:hypothetical protein GQ607_013061 [Colletotrichum asianum]
MKKTSSSTSHPTIALIWTHSLPVLFELRNVTSSTSTSNPGCYATTVQLEIASLVSHLGPPPVHPTVLGVLGYSDSGNKLSPKNDLCTNVAFIPHVAVWFAGSHHTISLPLVSAKLSRDVLQLHWHRYNKRLAKVYGGSHLVKRIEGKQSVEIGRFSVHLTGKRAVVNVQSPPTTCQRAPPPSGSRT